MQKKASCLLILLICSFLLGVLIRVTASTKERDTISYQLPAISLEDSGGDKLKTDDIDQLSLIIFWLPQSESCLIQLKRLNQLEKKEEKLNILAVALGAVELAELAKIKQELELEFKLLRDKKVALAEELEVATIPLTVIYHPQLKEFPQIVGNYKIEELLDKLNKIKN